MIISRDRPFDILDTLFFSFYMFTGPPITFLNNLQINTHSSGYEVAWGCGTDNLAKNEASFLVFVNKVTNHQILQKAWIIKRLSASQELSYMEFSTMPKWMNVDDLGCSQHWSVCRNRKWFSWCTYLQRGNSLSSRLPFGV